MEQQSPNERRLEDWMRTYGTAILRTCFVILSDAREAEDAMQDTFLRAWRAMDTFEQRNGASVKTWLMRILIHQCYAIYNQKKKMITAEKFPDIEDQSEGYGEIEWQEMLRYLNKKQRIVVELYYGQQFKVREIAEALQIGQSAVKSRLQSARKALEKYYDIGKETSAGVVDL